jgi:hypothetical protein
MAKKTHPNKLLRAKPGDMFGKLLIQYRSPNPKGVYGAFWIVKCSCGSKPFKLREQYLFRRDNPKLDCGCSRRTIVTEHPREYTIWKMMNRRCYDSTHVSYEYYGGAGVAVCDAWRDGGNAVSFVVNLKAFTAFIKYVGPAPSKRHTLDRENPFKNYEVGNVRWATPKEQGNNKRSHFLKDKLKRAKETADARAAGATGDEG